MTNERVKIENGNLSAIADLGGDMAPID